MVLCPIKSRKSRRRSHFSLTMRHFSLLPYSLFFISNHTANVVEGMFSLWVGYRCYDFFSHSRPLATFPEKVEQSVDSVDAIAAIPLCSGRSKIAEAVCPEWIDITKQQIPAAYWKALDDGRLRDERIWKAIQTFSNNCELRLTAEGRIRRELSLPRNQAVELPARIGAEHV